MRQLRLYGQMCIAQVRLPRINTSLTHSRDKEQGRAVSSEL